MRDRQVVITGIGLVTPLGDTLAAFGAALHSGHGAFGTVVSRVSKAVPGARVVSDPSLGLTRGEALLADRSTQFALLAASRALHDAGWTGAERALQHCGVFVGSGAGPTESVNVAYRAMHEKGRMPALTLLRCLPSGAASAIAIRHGLRGPAQSYSSACASSTLAIGEAMRAIRHGYLDMALVGGTEAPFGDGTVMAWDALRVLAPLHDSDAARTDCDAADSANRACRPFDRSRRGLVLGEGAVFFVIEAAEHAAARRAPTLARLAGYAATGDGHHWTEPSSPGQVRAMTEALDDACISPGDVGAINAHGTGTLVGDEVECASIAAVFGAGTSGPAVSSTKAAHGHLLGASGAIELAAAIVVLNTQRVPPTRNLRQPDDACAVNLVWEGPVSLRAGQAVLSNSFAFGGSNACLVVA